MIRVERNDEGVAELVLDRAEKRNALTPGMLEGLCGEAGALAGDASVRVVVLRGAGSVFCAGFDLSLCRDESGPLEELLRGLSRAVRALRRLEATVVASVEGAAIAGGCALLGGADVVVTHGEARFGYPVVSLGISPAVSAPTLEMAVGAGRARERLLDPSLFDGGAALAMGLAHVCEGDAARVLPRARAEAGRLASMPAGGARSAKAWLNGNDGSGDDGLFERGLGVSLGLVGGAEERELLAKVWSKERA